jgi:hypothetical protein
VTDVEGVRAVCPVSAEETYPNLASLAAGRTHRSNPNPAIGEQCHEALVEINRLRREVELLERKDEHYRILVDDLATWRAAHLRVQAALAVERLDWRRDRL